MKRKIRSYLVFASLIYRMAVCVLVPAGLAGIAVYIGRTLGEAGIVAAAAMLVLDIFCVYSDIIMGSGIPAGYMLMAAGMLPTQMIYSLSASAMVQTSPCKKKMQTSVPAAVTFGNMVLIYFVSAAERSVIMLVNPGLMGWGARCLLMHAALMGAAMLYLGIAYKYFAASTLCIVPVLVWALGQPGIRQVYEWNLFRHGWISFAITFVLGLVILAAGGLLQYLLTLLFYRVPLSKSAQSVWLRRELI